MKRRHKKNTEDAQDDGFSEKSAAVTEGDSTRGAVNKKQLDDPETSRLCEIVSNIRDIVFSLRLNPMLQFDYISPSVENITGYSPHELYQAPEILRETVDSKDREMLEMVLTAQKNILDNNVEIRWRTKKGPIVWLEICASPVSNEKGEIFSIDGIARDVTHRKPTKKSMMESERRLLQIIDVNSIPTLIIDENHTISYWNKAIEKLTGLSSEEMIGSDNQWKAFYKTKRPILADLIIDHATLQELARYYNGNYHVSKDHSGAYEAVDFFPDIGKVGKWFSFTAMPLTDIDGTIIGAIEILQDITEQKLAENALKEQLIFFQTLIDTIPHPIYYKDIEGFYLGCNKAFSDTFGVSQTDILGKTVYELLPAGIAKINDDIDRYLAVNPGVKTYASELSLKDGTQKSFILNKATFSRSDGTLAGIVGVLIDMTDHKRLEEKLRQAQKMEAVGTLAAGIAHDFNNILATVMMNAELVLLESSETEKNIEELEQILKSSYRAKDLVNQILTFSRQAAGEKKPINICPLVKESLKLIKASLPSTIEIHLSLAEERCYIQGSPVQIQQVILNLCNNAAYAMKKHGGILNVSVSPFDVGNASENIPSGVDPGEYVRLTVSDTGEGIEESIAEQVFDPFFTTKSAGEGSGLGLSVVHGIVKNHNGFITFSSKSGAGTEFFVFFPRISVDEVHDDPEQMMPVEGTESILIVDDEEELVNVMKKVLTDLNYNVVTKTSSVEALVFFRNHYDSIDLVVTDLTMPRITGTELAERMKNINPAVPIILCTGYNEGIVPDEVQRHGIDSILKKPFSRSEFANKIRNMLTGSANGSL